MEGAAGPLTCPTTGPQGPGVRGRVDPTKNGHPLSDRRVEVVVVGNGGDPDGIVLRRGVGPIAVPGLEDAGVSIVCEFGCLLILALHTAHYL